MRHTFHTSDDSPDIVLPNRLVQKEIGETFTVQIRMLNSNDVGQWSEVSHVLSLAKDSPLQVMKKPRQQPPSSSRTAQAKRCGDAAKIFGEPKTPGFILGSFLSKFSRSTAKA